MKIIDGIIFISFQHWETARTLTWYAGIEVQLVVDANKITSRH
jgi:hypothetical protein